MGLIYDGIYLTDTNYSCYFLFIFTLKKTCMYIQDYRIMGFKGFGYGLLL